jgi:hypothetical protein
MDRKIIALLASLLVAVPFENARCEVTEPQRAGPACDAATQACILVIKIAGKITAASFDQVKLLVEQTHRTADSQHWYFTPPMIEIDSPGGTVDAAINIGRLLRKEQAAISVAPEAICFSSCVLVIAGAVTRIMGGRIGIHRPYFEVPADQVTPATVTAKYQKMLEHIRAYFREMNVSE